MKDAQSTAGTSWVVWGEELLPDDAQHDGCSTQRVGHPATHQKETWSKEPHFSALSHGNIQFTLLYASCREETGDFFAVDIGGTNYRVILVSLSDKKGEVVSCPVKSVCPHSPVSQQLLTLESKASNAASA